jgi:type II secretory pathway pseudopilin PulG
MKFRFLRICAVLVGGVMVVAGLSHGGKSLQFFGTMVQYDLLPSSIDSLIASVLPWLEVSLGVMLLLDIERRIAATLAVSLSVVFLFAQISALARGMTIDCGCFGGLVQRNIGSASLATTLSVFLASACISVWGAGEAGAPRGRGVHPFGKTAVSNPRHRSHPNAVTVVEIIIVMALIGVLVSLTLAGVMVARESARNLHCQSNLRNVSLAFQNHLSTHDLFPTNGGYGASSTIESATGGMTTISTFDRAVSASFLWGVGSPGEPPKEQAGSWAYSILPFLEQETAYRDVQFGTPQSMFLCPSRSRQPAVATVDDLFGSYQSGGWAWAKTDYAANLLLIRNRPEAVDSSVVTDGLSNTILVGEKSYDTIVHQPTTWYWDEPLFSGGSKGTARLGDLLVPDGDRYLYKENWGSPHKSVNFSRADGSVFSIGFDADFRVFTALLTPNGRD